MNVSGTIDKEMERNGAGMSIFDRELDVYFSGQVTEARRFFIPRQEITRGAIVVGGGSEHVGPSYEVSRQGIPYFAIELVVGGTGTVHLNGKEHRLTPGTVFTYGPELPHQILTDPRRPLVKYFVDARLVSAQGLLKESGLKPGQIFQTTRPAEVLRLFDQLIATGQRRGKFSQVTCDHLFAAMIYLIVESATPMGSIEAASFATYQRCLRIIESKALELKSIKEAASACGINEAYLCRLFRRYDQLSPYQWLLRLKMNHAAASLRQRRFSVQEVARQLGYSDAFHFSKVFKRVLGVSPTQFV